jgi:hypothetical protein
MLLTENLDTFLADFGDTVVFNGSSYVGVLDAPDNIVGSLTISTEYALTVKDSVFSGVVRGDTLTVAGVSYVAREYKKIGDGKFGVISLSRSP